MSHLERKQSCILLCKSIMGCLDSLLHGLLFHSSDFDVRPDVACVTEAMLTLERVLGCIDGEGQLLFQRLQQVWSHSASANILVGDIERMRQLLPQFSQWVNRNLVSDFVEVS